MVKGDSYDIFFKRLKNMFSSPSVAFDDLENEKTISTSLLGFVIIYLICNLISYTIGGLFRQYMGFSFFLSTTTYIIAFFLGIGMIFAFAYLQHVFSKSFGGSGRYKDAFNVVGYSSIPGVILGLIPIVGFLGGIYSLVLNVMGIKKIYKISTGNSVLVVFLPLIILFLIMVGILVTFIMALRSII